MNVILLVAAGAVAIAVMAVIVWMASHRTESQLTAVRHEMQGSIAAQNQLVTAQVNHLTQTLSQELGQVRQELHASVASTGQLASDAQRDVAERLKSSTDALVQMTQRIGEMQQASQDLSKATQTLQSVLGGAKTRGSIGSRRQARSSTRSCAAANGCFRSIRNFRLRRTGGLTMAEKKRGASSARPCAPMPIRSRRNTSCPARILLITP